MDLLVKFLPEVLLIQWSQPVAMQWQMAEIFSGVGNVSKAFRQAGFNVCSYDVTCDGTHMNFLTSAGFAPGSESILVRICFNSF